MNIEYLRMAFGVAETYSEDTSTQVGAVLVNPVGYVIGCGANKLPPRILRLPERFERPAKYLYTEHAERNAIFAAARSGYATYGCTLYASWFACADCARAIIEAGIVQVVGYKPIFDLAAPRWIDSIKAGNAMLDEAGVIRTYYDGDELHGLKILVDGKRWPE